MIGGRFVVVDRRGQQTRFESDGEPFLGSGSPLLADLRLRALQDVSLNVPRHVRHAAT